MDIMVNVVFDYEFFLYELIGVLNICFVLMEFFVYEIVLDNIYLFEY